MLGLDIEQINFRMSSELKMRLEERAAHDNISTARVLRMAALWYTNGKLSDSQLEEALALELAAFPENRGRKPKKVVVSPEKKGRNPKVRRH